MLLLTRNIVPDVLARAKQDYHVRELNLTGALDPKHLLANLEGVTAILCNNADKFDKALLDALPADIKVIATNSVGLDHIDLSAAKARGIEIRNTPGVLSEATAEIALTLMLMTARRTGEGERFVRARQWKGFDAAGRLGWDVHGKVLGIFGMGRIGQILARMARGLNMSVHYHNRTRLPPEQESGAVYYADEESFLKSIDFLSINTPGGESTYHWLNAQRLALMRPGSFVINTGRGTVVDDHALIAALRSGHIAGAGLDVYEGEPDINPDYYDLESVVLLPHIGSATIETRNAMGYLALDGIKQVIGVER